MPLETTIARRLRRVSQRSANNKVASLESRRLGVTARYLLNTAAMRPSLTSCSPSLSCSARRDSHHPYCGGQSAQPVSPSSSWTACKAQCGFLRASRAMQMKSAQPSRRMLSAAARHDQPAGHGRHSWSDGCKHLPQSARSCRALADQRERSPKCRMSVYGARIVVHVREHRLAQCLGAPSLRIRLDCVEA